MLGRCLVPASGVFEWQKSGSSIRQPFYIYRADHLPLAGLWARWSDSSGNPVEAFTILTTEACAAVHEDHDQVPVIVRNEQFEQWLASDEHPADDLESLLKPAPADLLAMYPVSLPVGRFRKSYRAADPRWRHALAEALRSPQLPAAVVRIRGSACTGTLITPRNR